MIPSISRGLIALMLYAIGMAVPATGVPADMTKPPRDMTGNIVVNGSFNEPAETRGSGDANGYPPGTTALKGWTVSGGFVDVLGATSSRRVNIGPTTVLSQRLDLIRGVQYRVSISVTAASNGPPHKNGKLKIAGQVFPIDAPVGPFVGDPVWNTFQFYVMASGPTTLEITSLTGDPHGIHVADVCVTPAETTPAGPVVAEGTVVSVDEAVLVLNQDFLIDGKSMKIPNKFYFQKSTRTTGKPVAGARVRILFERGVDGRRMLDQLDVH